jgi:hypothetical protein
MGVFISYSSKDKEFVDKLAIRLVKDRIKVWVDRWEINVGDSLIDKIQKGLTDSSFLIVVLSKHSVESEWCRRELNSGLIREIENKRVVILPIVVDDCERPMFLREKKYADFKMDFETGYNDLIVPLQSLFSEHMGQIPGEEYDTDYALDWGLQDDQYYFNIDSATFYKHKPFSILSQTTFFGNDIATMRWKKQAEAGFGWLMKEAIVKMCLASKEIMEIQAMLFNDKPYYNSLTILDPTIGAVFEMQIRIRILGRDTGKDTVYDYPSIFHALDNTRDERLK